ncbi:DUF5316 domain-containing protein [Paenibacillus methanolicus]|uniref:DUF5316 domain-containing protein n=1 Tax=Paenibacillus methanolicus TaxID=582686 RepID=UPI0011E6C415|nr:DUF5316 domain-containing protein [Paenibacillus methanolicus]
MRAVGAGLLLSICVFTIAALNGDLMSSLIHLFGLVGLGCIILAALFMGAFIDPDTRRVDHFTDTEETASQRTRWSKTLLLVGLPNIVLFVLTYLLDAVILN